jgi:hypothetical protein
LPLTVEMEEGLNILTGEREKNSRKAKLSKAQVKVC